MKITLFDPLDDFNGSQEPDDEHTPDNSPSHNDDYHQSTWRWKQRVPLPVHDGMLPTGIPNHFVHYHIGMCFCEHASEEVFCALAMRACQIGCIAADICRGRPISTHMAQMLTPSCIQKLENMWFVLDEYLTDTQKDTLRISLQRMPAIPHLVNGMVINAKRFEAVVRVTTGSIQYWASLSLQLRNGRWICTFADIG